MKWLSGVLMLSGVLACGQSGLQAQSDLPERDSALQDHPVRREIRREQRGGSMRFPRPFLMAGDPRFSEMLKLALVDEDKVTEALEKWPRFNEMSEMDKKQFIRRLQMFRNRARKDAMREAEALGLKIPESRKQEYLRSYWMNRIRIEREVRMQAQKELDKKMDVMRDDLRREWTGR